MSHTDKTRPLWVQVRDPENRWAMQEEHDHRNGVCNYDEWFDSGENYWRSSWWGCHLDYSYYGCNAIQLWPKPRRGHWDRQEPHGALRAQWRRDRQRLLKAADPDDVEHLAPRHKEFIQHIS